MGDSDSSHSRRSLAREQSPNEPDNPEPQRKPDAAREVIPPRPFRV